VENFLYIILSELGRIHEQLIVLLQDNSKLERFKELLEEDNNTTFSIFVIENNIQ
jgi:hypothetical protein